MDDKVKYRYWKNMVNREVKKKKRKKFGSKNFMKK